MLGARQRFLLWILDRLRDLTRSGSPRSEVDPFSWLSRTFDTAGEFGCSVLKRGFAFPGHLISPRFRTNDLRREFASSSTLRELRPPARAVTPILFGPSFAMRLLA